MAAVTAGAAAPKLGYRPGLDGLRALAVTAVFVFHALPGWLPGGWLGVDLFFVLSGFLITTLLLEEQDRGRIRLAAFWKRRAFRLMPAFLLVAAVCAVAVPDLVWVLGYAANWGKVAGAELGPLEHCWSLAIEEQFYVVWPLVVVMVRRRYLAAVAALLLAGSVVVQWSMADDAIARQHFGSDTRAQALLVGCLLAIVTRSTTMDLRRVGMVAAGFLAVVAVAGPLVRPGPIVFLYTPVAVAAGVVVLAVVRHRPRWLETGPLVWLGVRSYGVYLWHWPILWALGPGSVSTAVIAAVGTLAVAAGSYRWVETPLRDAVGHHVRPAPDLGVGGVGGGLRPLELHCA